MIQNNTDADELMRIARTRTDKALRFEGEFDKEVRDGDPLVCFMIYRGNFGWKAYQSTGEWLGGQNEDHVKASFDVYDHAELVDISDIPDAIRDQEPTPDPGANQE